MVVLIKKGDHAIERIIGPDDRELFPVDKRANIRMFGEGARDVVDVADDGAEQLFVADDVSAGVDELALDAT